MVLVRFGLSGRRLIRRSSSAVHSNKWCATDSSGHRQRGHCALCIWLYSNLIQVLIQLDVLGSQAKYCDLNISFHLINVVFFSGVGMNA